MDEEALKLEMRLAALEYLFSKMVVTILRASGFSREQIEQLQERFAEDARGQLFPLPDPSLSDLASAEWGAAVEHLITLQKEILARG
jgi:hypothetical protein